MKAHKDIIILASIALGIPVLLVMLVLSGNSGIHDGMGTAVALIFALGAFLAGFIFEIKRIADLPDATEQPRH